MCISMEIGQGINQNTHPYKIEVLMAYRRRKCHAKTDQVKNFEL